jgi:hypothetical protein
LIESTRRVLFRSNQQEDFLKQLVSDNDHLVTISIDELRQVAFDARGKFGQEYGMTSVGAEQYLNAVTKGLYQVVRSIMNEKREDIDTRNRVQLVSSMVNQLAKYRFNALVGMRAICCSSRLQLDGFVSKSYLLVTNDTVHRLFMDACDSLPTKLQLLCGELDGRDMTVVLAAREPLRLSSGKSGLYIGAVCQNGETAGRAIRQSPILLDLKSRSWSVAPFEAGLRVPHLRSKQLRDRMMRLGDTLADCHRNVVEQAGNYHDAAQQRVAPKWDPPAVQKLRERLVRLSDGLYVQTTYLDEIINLLPEPGDRPPSWQDVYVIALHVADGIRIGASLPVRQLAYRMLFR